MVAPHLGQEESWELTRTVEVYMVADPVGFVWCFVWLRLKVTKFEECRSMRSVTGEKKSNLSPVRSS